jgi:PAS domain-containing protein
VLWKNGRFVHTRCFTRDITERKRAEAELRYRHELLGAITDTATTAIFMMDERGRCTFMNPAAEQMTGYSFQEAEGKILHDLIHHTRPDGSPSHPKLDSSVTSFQK